MEAGMNVFESRLQKDCGESLFSVGIQILQVNLGYRCNLCCSHCHLDCGPDRTEMMDWETMSSVISTAGKIRPQLVDITGGAPEVHPHFLKFVEILRKNGHSVQVHTNLTVLTESGKTHFPEFFKDHKVHLVASLPCYLEEIVSAQRGAGVYLKSIRMLQTLNTMGYGIESDLPLYIIYNPSGPFLPPDQGRLEEDFRRELFARFNIRFTGLHALTNMPIGRFFVGLKVQRKDVEYMDLLSEGFNHQAVDGLMCRFQICVAWDGTLYDCDFNIALDLPLGERFPVNIKSVDFGGLETRKIKTGNHCFGCTAGFGSSCSGALVLSNP